MKNSSISDTAQSLIAEAAEWRLIELLFSCPSEQWKRELQSLAREVRDPDLRLAASLASEGAEEGVFHSIFGPGGPAPAREASYLGTVQLGYLMSELNAYYQAFAYSLASAPSGKEPPDHVSVESGFIGFLRLKQAFALGRESEADAAVAAEAAARFLEEHLSNIATPLSHALDHSGVTYLELAGKALARRAGPPRRQIFDVLDQDGSGAESCSFECGEL